MKPKGYVYTIYDTRDGLPVFQTEYQCDAAEFLGITRECIAKYARLEGYGGHRFGGRYVIYRDCEEELD